MGKMGGWKTKWGVIIGVAGGALLAIADPANEISYNLYLWVKLIGTFLTAAGTGLAGWGVAHKVEKAAKEIKGQSGGVSPGILAVLAAVMLVASCMYFQPAPSVCDDPAVMEGSFICQTCAKLGTTPEKMNGILLDSTAIAVVFKPEKREPICAFLDSLEKVPGMTWEMLVDDTESAGRESAILNSVISRNIGYFESPQVISDTDWDMLVYHWREQRGQLYCEDFD